MTSALSNLYSALQSVSALDANVINGALGDYVFFPLSHVFRQHQVLNDRALEFGLQCLEILIKTCWRLKIPTELAKQLLVLITFIVGGAVPGAEAPTKQRSEETKLAGMKCLIALFGSLERTGKRSLADVQYLPAVGHTVTTILGVLIESEASVDLQTAALDAVADLLFRCVDEEDIIASFYPGVVSGLVKVIGLGRTTKRPYQALRNTIKLLTSIICRVLGDRQTSGLPSDDPVALIKKGTVDKGEDLKVRRTTAWLKATASQTKAALENILRLRTHPKSEVRKAVFELCRDLLELCSASLAEAITPLVESMIVFSSDESDEDLAKLAESTLRVSAALNPNVKDAGQSSLHGWIVTLPRVMGSNDEDAKTRLIVRLSTSFKLLTEVGLETELLQDMLAGNIRDSLITANPVITSKRDIAVQAADDKHVSLDILLISNKGLTGGERIAQFPDVVLSHRSQTGTMSSMKRLLGLLGSSSETALTLAQRHIRESSRMGSSARIRSTSLWIAVQLLKGSLANSEEIDEFFDFGFSSTSGLQQRVTEELFSVSLSVLGDATEVTEETNSSDPMLQCLALESLSLIAQAQKQSFRGDLVDVLYPVVHLLGASSRDVQNHAIIALNNIAQSCAYQSAKDLLLDNVDYMVNAVALKLNTFDLSPQAPVVLGMMVKLAGASLVPYLDDIVVSIFSALDAFHGYEGLCEALFGVLGQIVEESARVGEVKAITAIGKGGNSGMARKRKLLTSEGLVESLRFNADKDRLRIEPLEGIGGEVGEKNKKEDFPREPWSEGKKREKEPPPDEGGDEDEDEDSGPPRPPEDQVIKPVKSYELVQRITRLSQHYLTHDSPTLRMKLLRLVNTASPLLAKNEDEFLPLVNDVWPVVQNRLYDDESQVVVAAADAIAQLAESCGGFLASRMNESWASIKKVYAKAYKELEREKRMKTGSLGIYSPHYRTWDALCRLLSSVVVNVHVGDEIVDEICEVVGAAVLMERGDLKRALEGVNADAVWLEVQSWRSANGDSTGRCRVAPVMDGVGFVRVVF